MDGPLAATQQCSRKKARVWKAKTSTIFGKFGFKNMNVDSEIISLYCGQAHKCRCYWPSSSSATLASVRSFPSLAFQTRVNAVEFKVSSTLDQLEFLIKSLKILSSFHYNCLSDF